MFVYCLFRAFRAKVYRKQENKYNQRSDNSDIYFNLLGIYSDLSKISNYEESSREIYINSQVSIFYDREFVERVEII